MPQNKLTACCSKVFPIRQRVLLAFLCFCVVSIAVAIRLIISVTLLEMVELRSNFTKDPVFDYCWRTKCDRHSEVRGHEAQFKWSEHDIGLIISIFSVGYCIVQIPVGILVDVISEKCLWGIGMFIASILTFLLPMVINMDNGYMYLLITRVGIGFFIGPVFVSMNSLLRNWFPANEIWLASGLVYSGVPFGGMISALCSGIIMHQNHKWSSVFTIFGYAGCGLSIIFFLIIYDTPEKNPCISNEEQQFLNVNVLCPQISIKEIPFRAIVTDSSVIGLVLVRAGQDFGFNILMNYYPKYFSEILCLGIIESTFFAAAAFLCAFVVCIISMLLADYLSKHDVSTTSIIKIFSGMSSVLPAVFLVAAAFFKCDEWGVMLFFCLTMCGMAFYLSGICTNELALSRIFCGTISGISNAGSGLTAIVGPLVISYFIKSHSLTEWRITIWIIFIILNASTLPFMVWGSGDDKEFEKLVETLTPEEIDRRKTEQLARKRRCIFF